MIESTQNQYIKYLVELQSKRGRKKTRRFVVEGQKIVREGLDCGWRYETLIMAPEILGKNVDEWRKLAKNKSIRLIEMTAECYRKFSDCETPPGVALEMHMHQWSVTLPSDRALVLVCAHLQDPGNLGTAIRVADAAGAEAVLIIEPAVDAYNPKVVRASMGSFFRVPLLRCSQDFFDYIKENRLDLIAAVPEDGVSYRAFSWPKRTAIMVGSETHGLDEELLAHSVARVTIPIRGGAESLNAGVAAGILLFEAVNR